MVRSLMIGGFSCPWRVVIIVVILLGLAVDVVVPFVAVPHKFVRIANLHEKNRRPIYPQSSLGPALVYSSSQLLAKKHNKLLISDDLLSRLTAQESEPAQPLVPAMNDNNVHSRDLQKNKGNKHKKHDKLDEQNGITDEKMIPAKQTVVTSSTSTAVAESQQRRSSPRRNARFADTMSQPAHVGVTFDGVKLYLGNQLVLNDLSFTFGTGEKVALLGPNGIGKSTVLKLLVDSSDFSSRQRKGADSLQPMTGTIQIAPSHARIALLSQEFEEELLLTESLGENLMAVFPEESRVLKRIAEIEKVMDSSSGGSNSDVGDNIHLLDELNDLHKAATALRANSLPSRIDKVNNTCRGRRRCCSEFSMVCVLIGPGDGWIRSNRQRLAGQQF
jgi:hypothetical protein